MNISRIYAIFIRQLFLVKSNPTRLASIFLWIIISVIQWGFITKYLGAFGQATFSFVNVVLGAVILWEFTNRVEYGIMTTFLEDIWSNNFINIFASPLKIKEYISGMVLTSIATAAIGFLIMISIAGLGFGYDIFKIGILLLPFIFILFLFGVALGIFASTLIFRLGPAAEWLVWPIPIVLSIFCGVFYPIATLPYSLQVVAKLIPASYVFEGARSILSSNAFPISNLFIGGLLAIIYLLLAYRLFISVYRRNLKNGGIARFSAEGF